MPFIIMAARMASKYAKGAYLSEAATSEDHTLLCVIPVNVEKVVKIGFKGRRGIISSLKGAISSGMGWNRRVFVAGRTSDGNVKLLLLKTSTAAETIEKLNESMRLNETAPEMKEIDTDFASSRGISMVTLEGTTITARNKNTFVVVPANQGQRRKTNEFVLTLLPPSASASDEEKACFNDSVSWLSGITGAR